MDSEVTLAAAAALDSTIAPMEGASPAKSKRAATGGREAKPKAPKKLLSKEKKGVEATKRRGRHKNLKERNATVATAQEAQAAAQMVWQMQVKADVHVGLHHGLHPSLARPCSSSSKRGSWASLYRSRR
jgi:hypothetical protein